MKRRGLSPVVATVLLVGMVIVIALIIFLWIRGLQDEAITKFGKNIELVCYDVEFDASYSEGVVSVLNTGNVAVHEFKAKVGSGGSYSTVAVKGIQNLDSGMAGSGEVDVESGDEEIVLIPVLMGSSSKGEKTFVCDEDLHGKEVAL